MEGLVDIKVDELMEKWRPGSHGDDWTWTNEYTDLWAEDGPYTNEIIDMVKTHGIGFADEKSPILLGYDGRVWDGHHRILVAKYLGYEWVKVKILRRRADGN